MGGWFVVPETVRLTIDGYWFEVKKRLNEGERRAMLASTFKTLAGGMTVTDLEMVGGKTEVLAYLVDWNLPDPNGKAVDITTDAKKLAAINALDPAKFTVLSQAIHAHVVATEADMDASKKSQDGENAPAAISPSAA